MSDIQYYHGAVGTRTAGYCSFCEFNHSSEYLWEIDNNDGHVVLCPKHYSEYIATKGTMISTKNRCDDCWIKELGTYVWRKMELAEIDQLICEMPEHCSFCNR
jgi:nitrite reductase/ring-hydroxylating ferredoxin subunit